MRLWHAALLPYLPDAQLKGQLRELVAILHDWCRQGRTNHLLINRVMEYPKEEFAQYFVLFQREWRRRYGKDVSDKIRQEFAAFAPPEAKTEVYAAWHNRQYLRVCMANLYEKHEFGAGVSRISDKEWKRLLEGYAAIAGEEYKI